MTRAEREGTKEGGREERVEASVAFFYRITSATVETAAYEGANKLCRIKTESKKEAPPPLSLTVLQGQATLQTISVTSLLDEEGAMSHPASPSTLGFAIRFRLTDGLGEDGALELWDDFVAGPVEGRGLTWNAAADADGLSRLLFRPNANATEDDRRAVREWARRRGEIAAYDIGPLLSLGSRG